MQKDSRCKHLSSQSRGGTWTPPFINFSAVLWLFCGYCSLQTFCLNESPWPVCSGLCYYRRLPHWLSRSDAFCSGEPGSMKGQLAGCRTGRHVLSAAFLERFHSKSRPFPTVTIKVNSNAKNMAAVVFFLFNLEYSTWDYQFMAK